MANKQEHTAEAAHAPPRLPTEMTSDGRGVWAWGHALSAYTHWLHAKRLLREDIAYANRCGACTKWMTKACQRERNVNGRNHGPSMKATPCGGFVMTAHSAKRLSEQRAELVALELAGPQPNPKASTDGE